MITHYLSASLACIILTSGTVTALAQDVNSLPDVDRGNYEALAKAAPLINGGHAQEALDQVVRPLIDEFTKRYADAGKTLYCAHTQAEGLSYLARSANQRPPRAAMLVGPSWCDAMFLQAYLLVELNRVSEAHSVLGHVVELAPSNAHYLSEYAQTFIMQKDLARARATFNAALTAAKDFSPPATKVSEEGRALRGMGYIEVELGNLDAAEESFRLAVALNAQDEISARELAFVESKKNPAATKGK